MKNLLVIIAVFSMILFCNCEKHPFMERVTGTITEINNIPCGKSLLIILDDSTRTAPVEICKCKVTWQDGQRVRLSYKLHLLYLAGCDGFTTADIVFIEDIE